jgi:hypothetical protein
MDLHLYEDSVPEDPAILADRKMLDDNRQYVHYMNNKNYTERREQRKQAGIEKGKETRRRNKAIRDSVNHQTVNIINDPLAFLPLEFREERRRITVTELMKLLSQFPDKSHLINETYTHRLANR